jgi:ABC-2 type transport system permease protein
MSGLTGTARLIRLALRRDRFTLSAWILGLAGFLAATTAMFVDSFVDREQLVQDTGMVANNAGMRMLGIVSGPSVGGYTLHRDYVTLAVLTALMSVLAVVRHTRQSEELGRAEMLGAGVVGRYAPLAAAVAVALAADVVLAVLLGLAMMSAGLSAAGSLAAGASVGLVGVTFTGVAAVTVQLTSTTRGATGLAGGLLGLSFLLSGLGNMLGSVDGATLRVTSAWPAWLSPIGWGQQMRPFADNLWWPLGLAFLSLGSFVALAVVLVDRRDVGRGMWPERRGTAHASPVLLSPTGLVWRLQRGALLGWAIGLSGFALIFGAFSDQILDLEGEAAEWYATFGGEAGLLGAYRTSMIQMAGMAVAIYVVQLLLRLRGDEAQGTLEPVLGTSVTRLRWLGAYAANALAGASLLVLAFAVSMAATGGRVLGDTGSQLRDLVGAALVQLPAIGVVGATVVAAVVVVPRVSVGLSWALLVAAIMVGPLFGPSLELPAWLQNLSPFSHVPNAPAVAVTAAPLVGLTVVCAALGLGAALAYRRRDLLLPA